MTNKIALITGANKGIGLETARQLGQQNMTVITGARDRQKGEAAAKTLRDQGIDARAVPLDVTDQKSIQAAVAAIERDFDRLDILINNAGVMLEDPDRPTEVLGLDVWRQTFDTNVLGTIATTEPFLPLLRKRESGGIGNLSSILG